MTQRMQHMLPGVPDVIQGAGDETLSQNTKSRADLTLNNRLAPSHRAILVPSHGLVLRQGPVTFEVFG